MFQHRTPINRLLNMKLLAGSKAVEATATGNPLTFLTDLARPLKSLLIPFTPQQEGTGDPSPQNIRSIIPWNGLTVFGGGKNLLNLNTDEWEKRLETYLYINGVVPTGATARFTLEVKDDTADISGCYLGFVAENLAESSPVNYRWVIENGTVKSDMSNLSSGSAQFQRRCSNVFIYPATNETVQKLFNRFNIMVELGSTATAYEPYHPITETDIVFPSPVYGGQHEAVSGKLMNGWKVETLDDANAWTQGAYISYSNHDFGDRRKGSSWIGLCSAFPIREGVASGTAYARWGGADAGNFIISPNGSGLTLEDVKTLSAQGKIVLAYPLATPTEQTLTGHQITALVGNNTLWSDANGQLTAAYLKKG